MAQNHPNLYGGGAVNFDSTPYLRYSAMRAAKEQAKKDALDRGFAEELSKVTPTGVRDKELPAFEHAKNDLQTFWLQNKKKIHRNDIETLTKLNEKKNTLANILNTSKGAYKIAEEGGKMQAKGDTELWEDESVEALNKHSQPIYLLDEAGKKPKLDANGNLQMNPNWKPFDFTQVKRHAKPLSGKEMDNFYDGLLKNETPQPLPSIIEKNPVDKYAYYETPVSKYTNEQKKKIADAAKAAYKSDKEFAYTIDKSHPFNSPDGAKNVADFDELNKMYQEVYGKGIEGKEDFAAAEAIRRMGGEIKGKRLDKNNDELKFKDQEAKEIAREQRSRAFQMRMRNEERSYQSAKLSGDTQAAQTATEAILKNEIKNAEPVTIPTIGKVYKMPLASNVLSTMLTKNRRPVRELMFKEDANGKKTFYPIYSQYKTNEDGYSVPIPDSIDPEYSKPMTEADLYLNLGLKAETKGSFGKNAPKYAEKGKGNAAPVTILNKGKVR